MINLFEIICLINDKICCRRCRQMMVKIFVVWRQRTFLCNSLSERIIKNRNLFNFDSTHVQTVLSLTYIRTSLHMLIGPLMSLWYPVLPWGYRFPSLFAWVRPLKYPVYIDGPLFWYFNDFCLQKAFNTLGSRYPCRGQKVVLKQNTY